MDLISLILQSNAELGIHLLFYLIRPLVLKIPNNDWIRCHNLKDKFLSQCFFGWVGEGLVYRFLTQFLLYFFCFLGFLFPKFESLNEYVPALLLFCLALA